MVPKSACKISQTRAFSAAKSHKYVIRFADQIRREISWEYNAKRYKTRITQFHRVYNTKFKCFITSLERRHQTLKWLVFFWPTKKNMLVYRIISNAIINYTDRPPMKMAISLGVFCLQVLFWSRQRETERKKRFISIVDTPIAILLIQ